MKSLLLALLLASPPLAAWIIRSEPSLMPASGNRPVTGQSTASDPEPTQRLPVEVVQKGSAPQWIYVEVQNQAVPEPSSLGIFALGSLLLFRRRRCETSQTRAGRN